MLLSRETLHPLTMASFVLDYRLEGEPLQVVAKRLTYPEDNQSHSNPSIQELTLVLTSGIGCECELWLPTIKRLYQLQSQSKSSVHIRHVWTVEWPNHGDAGMVNESTLKGNFQDLLPLSHSGLAIRGLIRSGLVDLKNSKLIGISHSAGIGAHLSVNSEEETIPYSALIMVEPPLFHRSLLGVHDQYVARSIAFKNSQPDVWPTIEDAMRWHKTRLPWKTWHPEALHVFSETHFRSLPTAYHSETEGVTPKTYKEQFAASFNDAGSILECIDRLPSFCASVPVHLIYGTRQDFWPKELNKCIQEITRSYEPCLASISHVPEASHFPPEENPQGLATAILRILRGTLSTAKL